MDGTRRTAATLTLAGAMLLSWPGEVATGVIFNVDDTSDLTDIDLADGVCLADNGKCTLRAAVQQTNALTGAGTDTINLPAGTYALTIVGVGEESANNGDLDITDDVDIVGDGPGETIIDARGIDRVFEIHAAVDASITGVTIRGGVALHSVSPGDLGGGIRVGDVASLDLQQCAVLSNTASAGGGLWAGNASVTAISDCSFRDNMAVDAGLSTVVGAAIVNRGAMDLYGVEVSHNRADFFGGTVHSVGVLSVRNSTISGHETRGLSGTNSELDVVNSTIINNSRGGLSFFSATGNEPLTVRNSILANNGGLGGVDCELLGTEPTDLDFRGEHNLDSDGSCPLDGGEFDLPNTDPQLGPLQLNGGITRTHVPRVGSPVIDVGNDARCETADQRGAPRPLDGGAPSAAVCDMGAVEVLPCEAPFNGDEVIPASEIAGTDLFEACYTITNGAEFRVLAGAVATWKARDALTLQDGFSVLSGGTFEGLLDPAAGSSIVLP